MSKLLFGLVLVFSWLSTVVNAADAGAGLEPVPPLSPDTQRSRLQAERARAEADYQRGEADCYARFAVTDCIRKLRQHRREVLDPLRQQEIAINALERQRKAQEHLDRISQKISEKQQAEDAARRAEPR